MLAVLDLEQWEREEGVEGGSRWRKSWRGSTALGVGAASATFVAGALVASLTPLGAPLRVGVGRTGGAPAEVLAAGGPPAGPPFSATRRALAAFLSTFGAAVGLAAAAGAAGLEAFGEDIARRVR